MRKYMVNGGNNSENLINFARATRSLSILL